MTDELEPTKPKFPNEVPVDFTPHSVTPVDPPTIDVSVNWFDLVRLWIIESIKTDILQQLKGGTMKDPKTTITGLLTGIAGLLSYFGIVIPESIFPFIVAVGVMILGFVSGDSKKQ